MAEIFLPSASPILGQSSAAFAWPVICIACCRQATPCNKRLSRLRPPLSPAARQPPMPENGGGRQPWQRTVDAVKGKEGGCAATGVHTCHRGSADRRSRQRAAAVTV